MGLGKYEPWTQRSKNKCPTNLLALCFNKNQFSFKTSWHLGIWHLATLSRNYLKGPVKDSGGGSMVVNTFSNKLKGKEVNLE